MAVEAARAGARGRSTGLRSRSLWFSTVDARLPRQDQRHRHPRRAAAAADVPAVRRRRRGPLGRRRAARRRSAGGGPALVVAADIRTGLPGSADEAAGGDAGRRAAGRRRATTGRCSPSSSAPAAPPRSSSTAGARRATRARSSGRSVRREPLRRPRRSRRRTDALEATPASRPTQVDRVVVAGAARPGRRRAGARSSAVTADRCADDLAATVGNTGAAQPGLLLADALEQADARVRSSPWCRWPTAPTSSCSAPPTPSPPCGPRRPVADQVAAGAPVAYGKFLAWRGMLRRRAAPPARAGPPVGVGRGPQRATGSTASSAPRPRDGARAPAAARVSIEGGDVDDMEPCRWPTSRHDRHVHRRPAGVLAQPAGRVRGRRLRRRRPAARSSSPTSTPPRSRIGDRVEMTFRRLFTRRRHPQLLLEGPPGPHRRCRRRPPPRLDEEELTMGIARHQGPGRHRRHGLHAVRRALGQGPRRPAASTPPTRRSPRPASTKDDVDAYWLGTAQSGMSGITLARPLQLEDKPVTRVENYCATGSEALRQAALRGGVAAPTTWPWPSASRR